MSTALLTFDMAERRALASDPSTDVTTLADGLAGELEPLIGAALPIPERKARLTRIGGRCPVHGLLLAFDPFLPHRHRCDRCGRDYVEREHDDWWAMGAQLWTAERAVHAAALFVLRGETRHGALAARILRELTARYRAWPNTDNVLGPSRPFFSTYLESIWLLNLCHAAALLESGPLQPSPNVWSSADAGALRDQLVEPSRALIGGYNEGASNRQVWNEAAILSASRLLDDDTSARARLDARGGVRWLLANGLLDDGSWYEGENYHLFAHRGLWYGVQLMQALDEPLSRALNARYCDGFLAPFTGLLPDETFPSRRDSQYGSSIRQWRTAEWCELGWAHSRDRRMAGVLTRLYDGRVPRRETGRARSTADAECNSPPTALTRADLSWRALLMATVDAPPVTEWRPGSACLPAQGVAVIRRDGGCTYVALEGGHEGGGHGHPDQLALTLQTEEARWLEDPGTGSYVERALHWYRSTLAHHAPLIDGASQAKVPATLLAFDDHEGFGWIVKRVDGIAEGVHVDRTIVVGDGYLLDLVEWTTDVERLTGRAPAHVFTLPIAGTAVVQRPEGSWLPVSEAGAGGIEDGFDFVVDAERLDASGDVSMRVFATRARVDDATDGAIGRHPLVGPNADLQLRTPPLSMLVRATVPGAPGHGTTQRHWITVPASTGRILGCWTWPHPDGAVDALACSLDAVGEITAVVTGLGTVARHSRTLQGWHVELESDGVSKRIVLSGFTAPSSASSASSESSPSSRPSAPSSSTAGDDAAERDSVHHVIRLTRDRPWSTTLGETHYVPTEQSWTEAGRPSAQIRISTTHDEFIVEVTALTGDVTAPADGASNALDNEHPDVNADGVQWYMAPLRTGSHSRRWTAAALHVPAGDPKGRTSEIAPRSAMPAVAWKSVDGGWSMRLTWRRDVLPLDRGGRFAFDLVVNERPPDRERRRGQLVLSGGGRFGYLAGNRRAAERYVVVVLGPKRLVGVETTLR